MTIYYSNLYELAPNRGAQTYIGRSPNVDHRAGDVAEILTFSIPTGAVLTNGDVIKLMPVTPAGFKLTRFAVTTAGLDGGAALVTNFGWASQASGVGIVTGSTGLRTATTTSATDAQLNAQTAAGGQVAVTTNGQAAGAFDELQITVTTSSASAGANGLCTVLVEGILP